MAPKTNAEALTLARAALSAFQALPDYSGYGIQIAYALSVVSASVPTDPTTNATDPTSSPTHPPSPHPKMTFRLPIDKSLCQSLGTLHGGATATIFDITTSLALCLIQSPGFWEDNLGVSRTLNVTYLAPVKEEEVVEVETEVVSVGRRMAVVRGFMSVGEGRGRRVAATCEHGKVALGGMKGGGAKL